MQLAFYTSQLAIQISRFNTAKNVAPYTFTFTSRSTRGTIHPTLYPYSLANLVHTVKA